MTANRMSQSRVRATRSDDERLLSMLALRDHGRNSPQIGALFGLRANAVRTIFQRIDKDTDASEDRA